jgi:Secretion system C-terminal sorting domain
MKQFLLFSAFILCCLFSLLSFSQTYKVDELKLFSYGDPDWNQEYTQQYTYDNGGNKETNMLVLSYPDGDKIYQVNKTYNANNDVILSVTQFWNDLAMQWENSSQETYTYYTGTSNVKDVTTYSLILGYSTYKILYEYSGNDIVKITDQIGDTGGLVNATKYDYTYNSPGMPGEEIESEWNVSTSMWDMTEKTIATYTSGLRTKIDVYNYESGNWATMPFERYLSNYSGTLEIEYRWESWNGAGWDFEDRELSTYDANGNKTVYIFENWTGVWEPYYKEEASYSVASPLGVESFENVSFKVFPNPASDVVNLSSFSDIEKIEMFNVLGEKVLVSSKAKQLHVESLKSGVYLLKVFSGNRSATKRIVIE